jgi:hypothetical protein
VALPVPLFSVEELPLKVPAPISTYSVGEEISNSAPIKIAWSPPGLAKHRRCALATLTSNLTLSIWSAEGRPNEEEGWSRRLIINNALIEHFRNWDDEPSHLTGPSQERLRLRSRIRTFAWAPALPCPGPAGVIGTRFPYGQHILAIANDDNHIVFVVIESPTSTFGVERDWRAEVLEHESWGLNSEGIFTAPSCFQDTLKQQRYVSHIAWSPWICQDETYRSVVVYATNEDVRAKCITHREDSIVMDDEVVYKGFELRYNGPMKFHPTVEYGDRLKLVFFTNLGLVQLTISVHDAKIIERTTHDLDGRWDQVSGVVWDNAEERLPRLHVSSHLSTLHHPTAVLEVSPTELKGLRTPGWREQIENNLALFSVQNDLGGRCKAKVWGLTSSPLGDYIAVCTSFHPSDMIEYGIPTDRRGTVAISSARYSSQTREAFPREHVSAEGVAYTLKKLADSTVEDPDELPAHAEKMVEKLVQAYTPSFDFEEDATTSTLYPDASELSTLIMTFKQVFFLNAQTLKDRYTILVRHASKCSLSEDLEKTSILYRLGIALQQLPTPLVRTQFSTEIFAQHLQYVARIDEIMGLNPAFKKLPAGHGLQPALAWEDTCDFCSAPIPLLDYGSAVCTNGHRFPRCGLSLLAIQAPGITKYCGICSTPYFSDEFVLAQEYVDQEKGAEKEDTVMTGVSQNGDAPGGGDREETNERPGNANGEEEGGRSKANGTSVQQSNRNTGREKSSEDDRRELPVTLARVLYLACDACIYCGGKFAG